jgi:aryl-alcohol dehydrogenase-like predicted oxidoreductase
MTAPTSDRRARYLAGEHVLPIGPGAMPMSVSGRPHEVQSRRTIDAALDADIRLLETADTYALDDTEMGHNEVLNARALAGRRDRALIATKGGKHRRSPRPLASRLRGLPETTSHRPHRPLPDPCAGP